MSGTTMVVVIVAIVMGCVLEMSRHWARSGRKHSKDTEAALEQLRQENAKLAERVATLETIVTDRGFDLDQQIRKLG
ncbi:conserved hypothetical protein [Ferrimonas balearica DSM 9799]|uniref:Phage shock protein B n=1 Tax=Ferrimonas balearica (strain DSM 9799 / CCM 4581 / KCTC 23876 / PAT) TaxID=550540 RepID=E1SQG3_FERBD|nr:hypothetical protein [Ferrimonas balearica]ADN74775.1 conserved hypothetical protein [Ferrimonas balearica DSM 9799]MBW3140580.1 hypothetical protein [Ferrimonas balearica]MBW3165443.1 hypothetical protein [Ferrimonas balearica]MBY5981346.1 hypothetical protein [Ferrimonas balearica]MBY6107617.1 hypothetical protein [Ferrimonas balearica]